MADSGEVVTVYNCRVGEHHTYFVRASLAGRWPWSHNIGCDPAKLTNKQITEEINSLNERGPLSPEEQGRLKTLSEAYRRRTHRETHDFVERMRNEGLDGKALLKAAEEGDRTAFDNIATRNSMGDEINMLRAEANEINAAMERFATEAEQHHLMTNKNADSKAAGGPYTPEFEALAAKRWWPLDPKTNSRLDHPHNLVDLPGHKGSHPRYNRQVSLRMRQATNGFNGPEFKTRFDNALQLIARDTLTEGHPLNLLATGRGHLFP